MHKIYDIDPNDSVNTAAHNKFESDIIQIEKDIDRTLTNHEYFGKGKKGQELLRTILKILSFKYGDVGYVQGMNFLVATFLYHCSPEITLFLITVLMEDYELYDIYREDVAGLHARNTRLKNLVELRLPNISAHFSEIGIEPQMFTTEWILDLFSHTIPLNYYGGFLDNFIFDGERDSKRYRGWDYFYQVVITILKLLENELMKR
jgi:hypothetical protein